jgi:hypothetical protein
MQPHTWAPVVSVNQFCVAIRNYMKLSNLQGKLVRWLTWGLKCPKWRSHMAGGHMLHHDRVDGITGEESVWEWWAV